MILLDFSAGKILYIFFQWLYFELIQFINRVLEIFVGLMWRTEMKFGTAITVLFVGEILWELCEDWMKPILDTITQNLKFEPQVEALIPGTVIAGKVESIS